MYSIRFTEQADADLLGIYIYFGTSLRSPNRNKQSSELSHRTEVYKMNEMHETAWSD